jgi:(2Fe-2S) ferredoxin
LNIISSLPFIHTLCVDNKEVRDSLSNSQLITKKKLPCVLVIFPDGNIYEYVDDELTLFINSLIEKNKPQIQQQPVSSGPKETKTPINRLVQNIPETSLDIKEEVSDDEFEDDTSPQPPKQQSQVPARQMQQRPLTANVPKVTNAMSKKSDIGQLINFSENKPAEKKSNSVSRSRSELMNREPVKIAKGSGHNTMKTSSLNNDIPTTKNNQTEIDIIEDIETEDEVIPFTNDNESGILKSTHKSKTDIKALAIEMANGRDVAN